MSKIQPETIIRREVKEALQASGWYCITNFQGVGSFRGLSDLTILKGGKVIFLEIKTPSPKSKQSPDQVQFQRICESHGVEYRIARDVADISDLLITKHLF